MRPPVDMDGSGEKRACACDSARRQPPGRVELVYRSQAAALRRRVRAQVGSAEEASDLVQEAFARLAGVRSSASLRSPQAFLNRIVKNLLIDHWRRKAARPPHLALGVDIEVTVPPDQGEELQLEQMRDQYRDTVASLPPRMRQVFVLHRIDGLSYREIALRLDISVRTVEWHIAGAIVRIAKELDHR